MGMVSLEQSHEVMAKLGTKVSWPAIPSEIAQAIIEDSNSGHEFTLFLANRGRMQINATTDGIVLPPGGRIHVVPVPVNEARPWEDAMGAAGPNTGRDWDVWKVGGQYPSTSEAEGLQQIILVNFGKITRSEENLAWGKAQNLRPASPRSVFAIGEHRPNLHRDLGMDPMAVVSLVACSFGGRRRACFVWWCGSGRKANLFWFDYDWNDYYWFAFVRE